MNTLRTLATTALVTVAVALGSGGAGMAQTPAADDHTAHHPATDGAPPPAAKPASPVTRAMPGAPGRMGGMPAPAADGKGMMMGGDMPRMMQMMHGMMAMQAGMGPPGMMPLTRIEGQLAFFKAELHITDAQAPQWNAFADTIRSNAATLRTAMQKGMSATGPVTAPEQMDQRIAMLTTQLETMTAMSAVAKPLYAVLSDEQKKTADELMADHLRGMRGKAMGQP